jgi:hypothetical protein
MHIQASIISNIYLGAIPQTPLNEERGVWGIGRKKREWED